MDALHERPAIGAGGQLPALNRAINDHLRHSEPISPQALAQLIEILVWQHKRAAQEHERRGLAKHRRDRIRKLHQLRAQIR